MKILNNLVNKNWSHRTTCRNCKSELEIERSDLKFVPDMRDGDAFVYNCPCCAQLNYIAASFVPEHLRR